MKVSPDLLCLKNRPHYFIIERWESVSSPRNTLIMKTMIKQGKVLKSKQFFINPNKVALKNEKQETVGDNTSKKTLMKNLFISQLCLLGKENNEQENVYTFTCELLQTTFKIVENKLTNEKVLFQNSYLLDNNTNSCNTLLQKLVS